MFDVVIINETPKAVLIEMVDTKEQYWVPRSVIPYMRKDPWEEGEPANLRTAEIQIDDWWIEKEGL